MSCRICSRDTEVNDGLCIWCEIFGTVKVHGRFTFPDGKLTIAEDYQMLPSHIEENQEIRFLKEFEASKEEIK